MSRHTRLTSSVLALVVALGVLAAAQRPIPGERPGSRVATAAGRTLREWDDRVIAMERQRELRLRAVQADPFLAGRRHERLDQYYRGVRVFGGQVVRETDGRQTLSITASLSSGIAVDTSPTLSRADAIRIFQRETGATFVGRVWPELMVFPRPDGSFALTYRVSEFVDNQLPVVFVNARSGVVEFRYNNLRTQQATALVGSGILASQGLAPGDQKKMSVTLQGSLYQAWDQMRPVFSIKTYDLKGNLNRTKSLVYGGTPFLTSDLATNTGSTWADAVVVDGHTYMGWTYDYFFKRHNWRGYDGSNARAIIAIVHPVKRADYTTYSSSDRSTYYTNAFFCGACGYSHEDVMMFGEGLPSGYIMSDGQYWDYFAGALDIVAHEYTHGVTTYTSDLIYVNESGALDEAFSDIMGVSVRFFLRTPGSGVLQADYAQGRDAARAYSPGSVPGVRNLANPASLGDPDHYSLRYTGPSDGGGVHTNSTIVSHAFYLAVEGGTNRTSGLSVQGVGGANRDQIEKVIFKAFTTLPSSATFSQARAKTIQAARDLYGVNSNAERAMTQAWDAVGVF